MTKVQAECPLAWSPTSWQLSNSVRFAAAHEGLLAIEKLLDAPLTLKSAGPSHTTLIEVYSRWTWLGLSSSLGLGGIHRATCLAAGKSP